MFAVGRNCRQPETAARFIGFLLTDVEAAKLLGRTRGAPAARDPLAALLQAGQLPPLELQAHERLHKLKAEGRIDLPSPLFEHARLHKFMREVFETVAYGKSSAADAGGARLVRGRQRAAQTHPVGTMAKHQIRQFSFTSRQDPDTGARVTRLTPPDITCHRNYFYQKCFTNDGSRLIFAGEFGPAPSPNWNYHLLDLPSQTARQLTEGEGENTFGGFLSPDDRSLFRARRTPADPPGRATPQEDVAYTVPQGWVGYGTWVANSACTKMVGIEIAEADWFPLSDWRKFDAMFHKKPLCRLFSIDLASGQRRVILEQQGWLGHPQYRPFDDHTVAYCHEGPHDLIDARMWFINEDGTNRRCGKEHRDGESCSTSSGYPTARP